MTTEAARVIGRRSQEEGGSRAREIEPEQIASAIAAIGITISSGERIKSGR